MSPRILCPVHRNIKNCRSNIAQRVVKVSKRPELQLYCNSYTQTNFYCFFFLNSSVSDDTYDISIYRAVRGVYLFYTYVLFLWKSVVEKKN